VRMDSYFSSAASSLLLPPNFNSFKYLHGLIASAEFSSLWKGRQSMESAEITCDREHQFRGLCRMSFLVRNRLLEGEPASLMV
jgi:hypothetical protein